MPAIDPRVHVAHIALRVCDVARSAEFYRLVGGLEVREADEERAVLGARTGGAPVMHLRRAPDPGRPPQRATGLFHSALLFEGRPALGAALRRIAQAGVPISGASDHGVSEALYLDDPDGHGVELYRDRPREDWPAPQAPGERVSMFTAPLDVRALLAEAGSDDPAPVTLGHAHLKVSDIEAAERFWVQGMGFDLTQHFGGQASFVAAGGYHHHLGMNVWHSRGAAPEDPAAPGLDHVALAYPSVAALAEGRAHLKAAGPVPDAIGVQLVLADGAR